MEISTMIDVPESLYSALQSYLDGHPEWDQNRAMAAALSLFLMQNGNDRDAARVYIDSMFSN